MQDLLNGSVVLWSIIFLTLSAAASALLAWRTRLKLRHATHYFPKYQAEIKWQMYTTGTAVILMALGLLVGYYVLGGLGSDGADIVAASEVEVVESSPTPRPTTAPTRTPQPTRQIVPTRVPQPTATPSLDLPIEFSQVESELTAGDGIVITNVQFSAEMSDAYIPVNPTQQFEQVPDIIYATFDYDGMQDGLAWSWLWRLDGDVIEGDNELWQYGQDGPGYLYLSPNEGIEPGVYSAEIWINDSLFMRQSIAVGVADIEPTEAPPSVAFNGRSLVNEAGGVDDVLTNVQLTVTPQAPDLSITILDPIIINERAETAVLPSRYRATVTEQISDTVAINILRLSADIHMPACPQTDFCLAESAFSLSAAFHTVNLPEESELTFIWRHNDTILRGQSETWLQNAPAIQYIDLMPENGLLSGEYSLEIWANNVQFSLATIEVMNEPPTALE